MECPKCHHRVAAGSTQCAACGVVFAKYEQYLEQRAALERERALRAAEPGFGARLWSALMTPPEGDRTVWWARAIAGAALALWGASYMVRDLHQLGYEPAFMHAVNLPFHEAGHLVFGIFGEFVGSLGGTLGQLLVPVVCGVALFLRADTFGCSVCLLWFGENFLDIAPYMADARAGELPLLGGNYGKNSPYGFHDWEFILGETGLLAWDTTLAAITLNAGRAIMALALALLWGAWLLWRGWRESA